ncbi:glycosyltransferase [Rufibacter roseolus]|uniref:glycosyltransferase n=1 Tax=Rufibacter roseolus TaxID=2817375 RepID=UPI00293D5566|nr:glycosyltransferase [Rufibacter roseolus]
MNQFRRFYLWRRNKRKYPRLFYPKIINNKIQLPVLEQSTSDVKANFDICVLIPCFNNREGLVKSLDSIRYDVGKLCVVVVDDGSQSPVKEEDLFLFFDFEFPIHIIRIEQNAGITKALNAGLQWIEENVAVQYIARLDCGDLCHQDRFYKQASFLAQNPDVGLLGTWCTFRNPVNGFSYSYTTPTAHEAILSAMHFRNVFIHPTVMFRSEIIEITGRYSLDYPFVEDYALFFNILNKSKGAVLDEFLVACELNPKGISVSNRKQQLIGRKRVVSEFGSNPVKKLLANCKLLILRYIPYGLVLSLKNK